MLAGALEVQLFADIARIKADMDKAVGVVTSATGQIGRAADLAKQALGALGVGLSVGALVSFVKGAIDAADSLNKLTQRTGIAVESLSQLQYAAKLADVSHESLSLAIKKLNVSIAGGLAGDKEKVALFKQLGITTADLGKGTESVMLKMADAYAHAKDGAGKAAVSVALMGKAGDEMIPLLNAGGKAIRDLMKEADSLGLTIGGDFAERAEDYNDNLTRMRTGSQKLAILLGDDLVSSLGKAMQAFINARKEGSTFAAMLEGINTLLYGDDRHMANVAIVDLTDKILGTTSALEKAQANLATIQKQEEQGLNVNRAAAAAEVARLQTRLTNLNKEIDTHKNYAKVLDTESAAAKAAADAVKAARENGTTLKAPNTAAMAEYDAIIKKITEKIAAQKEELNGIRGLTEYEKFEAKIMADLGIVKATASAARKKTPQEYLDEAHALNDLINIRNADLHNAGEEAKFWAKTQAELAAAEKASIDERDRVNKSIADQTSALTDSNAQLQMEALLLGASDKERAIALGQLQIEQKLQHDLDEVNRNLLLTEEARVAARANLYANAAAANAQVAERAALQEQITLMGQIESTGREMWDAIWEGGNDTVKRLSQALKKFLLDLLYQMTAKQWIISIGASVTGGAAAAGGSSLAGSIVGSMFGAGGAGGALMAGAGWLTGSATLGGTLSAATSLMGTAGGFLSGATMLAGALGPIAIAALALGSIFGSKGGPKSEAGYAPGGMSIAGLDIGGNMQGSQRGDVAAAKQLASAMTASLDQAAAAFGVRIADQVGLFFAKDPAGNSATQLQVVSANYNRSSLAGGIENVGRSDAEFQAAVALAAAQLILTELQSSNLKGKVADYLKALDPKTLTTDQINEGITLAQNAKTLYDAFGLLGPAFSYVSDMTVQATNDLAKAAGGMGVLTANLSSYYENYFSEEEKRRNVAKQISATLAEANLNISADAVLAAADSDNALAQFRALQEQLAAAGPAGHEASLALMSVNGAFASLAQSTAQLRQQSDSLQVQLLAATGDKSGAAALQRDIDTATYSAAAKAIYDYNAGLQHQISVLNERAGLQSQLDQLENDVTATRNRERAALDETNRALYDQINALKDAQRISQERRSLETQLLVAQGDTVALRKQEREALDPLNRALYDLVKAAEDAKAAAQERYNLETQLLTLQGDTVALRARERAQLDASNQALYDRIKALEDEKRIAQERTGLENQLISLMGRTDAARQRELAGLDASNRALQEMIYSVQDARKETDNAYASLERAVNAQKSAAQSIVTDVKGVFDAVSEAVKALYGEVASTRIMQAAEGHAFITNALANARATGYLPNAADLQSAIGAVRGDMAQKPYASKFESDRDRLVLAGQLAELQRIAQPQLTTAEQQLAALDKLLETEKNSIDALRGIDTSVTSVTAAIERLHAAMFKEKTITQKANDHIDHVMQQASAAVGPVAQTAVDLSLLSAAQLAYYNRIQNDPAQATSNQDAFNYVRSLQDVQANFSMQVYDYLQNQGLQAYTAGGTTSGPAAGSFNPTADYSATGNYSTQAWFQSLYDQGLIDQLPALATGTNYVPQDMFARIHEGEAVVPKPYNPAAGGSSDVCTSIDALREDARAQATALVNLNARVVKVLERLDVDGLYVRGSSPDAPITTAVA